MEILPIRAFRDNYVWLLRRGGHAAVVDPGDAAPVLEFLAQAGLQLAAILVTHHHADHTGGIATLLRHARVPVFGPAGEDIEFVTQRVREPDRIRVPHIEVDLDVLDVPGHTRGHVAYYGPNVLFCGDTLFACGCGRLFEGSARQMRNSLAKLARLPAHTRIYCAHEYTQANVDFALAVEPDNAELRAWAEQVDALRARGAPTLPTTVAHERLTNPFLRWDAPGVVAAAAARRAAPCADADEVFAAIREWKNNY